MATEKKQIVEIPFFCAKTQKNYPKGSEYKGKRKDLASKMKGYKEPQNKK